MPNQKCVLPKRLKTGFNVSPTGSFCLQYPVYKKYKLYLCITVGKHSIPLIITKLMLKNLLIALVNKFCKTTERHLTLILNMFYLVPSPTSIHRKRNYMVKTVCQGCSFFYYNNVIKMQQYSIFFIMLNYFKNCLLFSCSEKIQKREK